MTRTKQCKLLKDIFSILHLLCLIGPFLYYLPYGYIHGETTDKISMSITIVIAVVLAVISFVVDVSHRSNLHRSIIWVLISGILFCLKEVEVFIWIMCIASILDELIFTKVRDHYKLLYKTNKEIDRRGK